METKNDSPKQRYALGVDLGFGDIKVVAYSSINGQVILKPVTIKLPTAIARAGRKGIEGLDNSTTKHEYEGKEYVVGADAINSDKAISCRDIDVLIDLAPLFINQAVQSFAKESKEHLNGNLMLATGLPIAFFKSKREALKAKISDFVISGQRVSFPGLNIFPQAIGIYFDYLLKTTGGTNKQWDGKTMVICDIGFNTIDILCVQKGICNRDESMMKKNLGVCWITRELDKELQSQGIELSEPGLKQALYEGKLSHYGREEDLGAVIKSISKEYAEYICREIEVWLGEFLQRAEAVILAGGGAYYVKEDFAKIFNRERIFVPQNPEFSNARGYAKALLANIPKESRNDQL